MAPDPTPSNDDADNSGARHEGDEPMIQLTEAITKRFPQGNEWAAAAMSALADDAGPTMLVHDVAEGWTGDVADEAAGGTSRLVDTLFVLTEDRLGFGRAPSDDGAGGSGDDRRWVRLDHIVAVDAIDDSPLPLQTIELELDDGLVLTVGWPESFTSSVVPLLIAISEGAGSTDDVMPRELVDVAGLAHDASALDDMAPSTWVEQPVDMPVSTEEVESDSPQRIVAALDFFNTSPEPAPASWLEAASDSASVGEVVESDAWTSLDARHDDEPVALGAFDVPALPPQPAPPRRPFTTEESGAIPESRVYPERAETLPVAAPTSPLAADAVAANLAAAGSRPWNQPGMVWPDPLRGVVYLGGHPGHPRKRKNGVVVFSPSGIEVSGSGFQTWEMSMDWSFVSRLEIQGPDEVMFSEHLKIDSTSSALIVEMSDATRMFFEVRTRRPPSLRAALAPVLLMVGSSGSRQ